MARRIHPRWGTLILTVVLTTLVSIPATVWASHQFADVPNSHTFHDAIDWMADNNITVGCNPPANNQYCPDDNVTRGQMAAFMKRLAENQVVDADTVDGVDALALAQTVYTTSVASWDISGVADFEPVLALDVPGGTWLIMAKAWYWNTGTADGWADCRLVSPFGEDNTWVDVAMDDDNDQVAASFLLVDGFDATSSIQLQCRDGGHSVDVRDAVITALRLHQVFEG